MARRKQANSGRDVLLSQSGTGCGQAAGDLHRDAPVTVSGPCRSTRPSTGLPCSTTRSRTFRKARHGESSALVSGAPSQRCRLSSSCGRQPDRRRRRSGGPRCGRRSTRSQLDRRSFARNQSPIFEEPQTATSSRPAATRPAGAHRRPEIVEPVLLRTATVTRRDGGRRPALVNGHRGRRTVRGSGAATCPTPALGPVLATIALPAGGRTLTGPTRVSPIPHGGQSVSENATGVSDSEFRTQGTRWMPSVAVAGPGDSRGHGAGARAMPL